MSAHGPGRAAGSESAPPTRVASTLAAVYLLATVQVVWFYLTRVQCYVDLRAFEQGAAPNPFQQRMLLMYPLRWAGQSPWLQTTAAALSRWRAWFPGGVRPEGLLEAAIDLLAVIAAGLAARALYRRSSPTGILSAYVYPLTLIMCASTYSHLTYHAYRFVADLPSMAFFSVGLLLLYVRARWYLFAVIFLLGTINRETTLLLLIFYAIDLAWVNGEFQWKRLLAPASVRAIAPLLAGWVLWRLWVVHRFQHNATLAHPRLGLNLGILLIPLAWPQLCGAFAFMLPAVLLSRSRILDPRLRAWLWVLPCWLVFMLYFGLLVEVRIFGELIPYIACLAALVAEQTILDRAAKAPASSAAL